VVVLVVGAAVVVVVVVVVPIQIVTLLTLPDGVPFKNVYESVPSINL
jgi:hypothetical protein